ncbi:MAG: class I SAM-dependent rRNA methyltransferase [bacterium]|nr:class I SAM-dependent rRNA methyltransferase [bacterium]
MQPTTFPAPKLPSYRLLDSGGGEKLERFGEVVLRRPDPQALWRPELPASEWEQADLTFVRESDRGGRWQQRRDAHPLARGKDASWPCVHDGATLIVRPTPFKHVGIFPEQEPNWRFVRDRALLLGDERRPRVLNLFAYTGAASVFAVRAGCDVTHVDASKTSITWARENADASGLGHRGLRLICDDALAFARREVRRGSQYEGILLDPPHYGRGPKGEKWQFEEGITPLLEAVQQLLAPRAFVVLSTYAIGYSPLALANLLGELGDGIVEAGELVLAEQGSARAQRLLPAGFCARWTRGIGE